MVKLTPDLIQQSMQYINPVRDRELDLRGYSLFFIFKSCDYNLKIINIT